MASYGFSSDHVNLIADNLRDRYKNGFPILKELLQNADDAKARRLVFGFHPGFKGKANHTLLQGPGLWVFNDGVFKKEDEFAIRAFGLNSKAGDSGAIGKFGLGMKSVFHLCEAFFYVAFDGMQNFDVFLNPWQSSDENDDFHGAWKDVKQSEFDALRTVASAAKSGQDCASWLLLWIPLRQRAHVPHEDGQPSGAIVDKYPGEDGSMDLQFLHDPKLGRKIRAVVPLLRHLESIELEKSDLHPGFKVQISIAQDAKRVDHSTQDLFSTGHVSDGGPGKNKLQFRIQQKALPGSVPFCEYKQLNAWPKTRRLNRSGKTEPVPDKSEAEGAVLVSCAPADGDRATLDIHWAVFLPTEEGLSYEIDLPMSMQAYRIVLHGQFFVDAGRRGIAGAGHLADKLIVASSELDDTDLHTGWNQAVAQQVVLPLLLPTVAQFADDHLNLNETEELARAILSARSKSTTTGFGKEFWATFKDFICDGQVWVRLITPEGLKWLHQRITSNTRLLKLPPPPRHDISRPWKVLPHLKELAADGCFLLDETAPSLIRTHSNWDDKTLLDVLRAVDHDETCTETGMAYLASFLSMEGRRYVGSADVQRALIGLLQKMLRERPLRTFRNSRTEFQNLASLVKPEYRFGVGTKEAGQSLNDITLKLLIGAECEKLLLPMDLDPKQEAASKGVPDDNETRNLLRAIDEEISRFTDSERSDTADQIEELLRAAQMILNLLPEKGSKRGETIRVNRSLRVLSATCARTHKDRAVSFDDLDRSRAVCIVFKSDFGFGTAAYPVATALAGLTPSTQVWVVSKDVAQWLGGAGDNNTTEMPLGKNANAAYEVIGKPGQALTLTHDMQIRAKFLRKMRPDAIKGDALIRGIRYVLHGSAAHQSDDEATLWINQDSGDRVWVKLKRMLEPDSWNVIDSGIAGSIPADDLEKLKIRRVRPDDVMAFLSEERCFDRIRATEFDEGERTTILKQINHDGVWKNMPLHQDTKGAFGPITEKCFVDPNGIAIASLTNGMRLFKLSEDPKLCEMQKKYIAPWSHETTIRQALIHAVPTSHWQHILEALRCEVKHERIPELKTTKWLPLQRSGAISPDDIIDLEPLADEIDKLAAQCDYCYVGVRALADEVKSHAYFEKLRPLFASDKSGLARLGQLMAATDGYSVGVFAGSEKEKLADYLPQLSKLTALPGWAIVNKASDAVGQDRMADIVECLLKEIQKPLDLSTLVDVLEEISTQSKSKKQEFIFNHYLAQLAKFEEQAQTVIGTLRLMARDGSWKTPGKLCVDVQGADRAYVLDKEQAKILQGIVETGIRTQPNDDAEAMDVGEGARRIAAPQVLVNYFKPWRELMPSGPIGGLFAVLGSAFRELADEWLKPHSFDNFVDQFAWNDPAGSRSDPVWDYTKSGQYTKLEALAMLDFIPTVSEASEIEVRSLLGVSMRVPLSSDYDNLLVGKLTWAGKRTGRHAFHLPLRAIPRLGEFDKKQLSDLVRTTCERVLEDAYKQRDAKIGVPWESLEKSEQLEVEVARRLILDSLPSELRKFSSAKKNKVLANELRHLKNLETSRAEKGSRKQAFDQIDREIDAAKDKLAELMVADQSVQHAVLEGIREKVRQNKYEPSSIAFELLQNADDAVVELRAIWQHESVAKGNSQGLGRFVMESTNGIFRFLHWGRPINHMGHGVNRRESHGEDLQRMLVLASSDKEDGTGLTGKFGLGFKSVLLATDTPCLLSGDLKVKILGGCLPDLWADADGAHQALQRHRLPDMVNARGTVVEFEVNAPQKRSQVLDRFAALAGLQCIFSKEIRAIRVNQDEHEWRPKYLISDSTSAEVGIVQLPAKAGSSSSHLLNLRLPEGCVALRLDSRGCAEFSREGDFLPPAVWVTAPTRESSAKSLILNSHKFTLDTGRGGLPHGESSVGNMKLAASLGDSAAKLVRQLVTTTRTDWAVASDCLGLNKDVTAAEFWASFLACIPVAKDDQGGSESDHLLGRFGGVFYEKFLSISEEIPNGLPGPWSGFVAWAGVSLSLNSRWIKLIEPLRKFQALVTQHPASGWVAEAVALQLKAVRGNDESGVSVMSVELLLDAVPHDCCSPEIAAVLADLLTELTDTEKALCSRRIAAFYFLPKDGPWQRGGALVKAGRQPDAECAPFAPPSSILNSAYKGAALALVEKFSTYAPFQAYVYADWILAAATPEARVGALRFLLSCIQQIKSSVRECIVGSWLEELEAKSPYLVNFSVSEKNQLLSMFKTQPIWVDASDFEPEPAQQLLQGDKALHAIRDWWEADGEDHLRWFDREFWPDGVARNFAEESDSRSAWMTLFAIGLMQRYGRTQNRQNRGYIDYMREKGYWSVFSNVDPNEDGHAWLNVLNEYGELQVEDETFSMWMDSFPRFYRVARWFSNYKHVFQSIDHRSGSQMASIISPSADPVLTGSGIYAPTLMKGLRLGQHVIVRELLRCGVLHSETAKGHAFKPGSIVKKLLSRIGFSELGGKDVSSQSIYKVLRDCLGDDASFNGAYDIPLQIMALDATLQERILGGIAIERDESDEY